MQRDWIRIPAVILLPAAGGVAWMLLSVYLFQSYGAGLFLGGPLAIGFSAALLGYRLAFRALRDALWQTTFSVLACAAAFLIAHLEGVICLLMALPLALPLALLAAWVTHALLAEFRPTRAAPLMLPIFLLNPSPAPNLHPVASHLEIAAPPAVVWRYVTSFSDLPASREWLFHTGLAYPLRAHIVGHGPGAVRYCEFSTGAFVEPIETWDEPRLLRFSVTRSPAPLVEISPYRDLHPPHLDGYFGSRRGQFLLTALPNGHTLLTGTTWYELRMGPSAYWRPWSDYIVHRIHMRVLDHIRLLSEAAAKSQV